jgi:hypothetical protein
MMQYNTDMHKQVISPTNTQNISLIRIYQGLLRYVSAVLYSIIQGALIRVGHIYIYIYIYIFVSSKW